MLVGTEAMIGRHGGISYMRSFFLTYGDKLKLIPLQIESDGDHMEDDHPDSEYKRDFKTMNNAAEKLLNPGAHLKCSFDLYEASSIVRPFYF